ncbi:Protein-lysine N-methyltransferase efm4, variant 2 [Balamuthia mandrillaris]
MKKETRRKVFLSDQGRTGNEDHHPQPQLRSDVTPEELLEDLRADKAHHVLPSSSSFWRSPTTGATQPIAFRNPWPTFVGRSLSDLWKFVGGQKEQLPPQEKLRQAYPVLHTDLSALRLPPSDQMQLTWIGHATMLLQVEGLTALFDPVWAERLAPVKAIGGVFGMPRYTPPPFSLDELLETITTVDLVFISHSHYDHCDVESIIALASPTVSSSSSSSASSETSQEGSKRPPRVWVVPLRLGSWLRDLFRSYGIKHTLEGDAQSEIETATKEERYNRIVELDWWQQFEYKYIPTKVTKEANNKDDEEEAEREDEEDEEEMEVEEKTFTVIATPCQHWSNRGLTDRNVTLWASFVLMGSSGSRIFFAGDTGYCPAFQQIGSLFGPFHLSMLPIGTSFLFFHLPVSSHWSLFSLLFFSGGCGRQ